MKRFVFCAIALSSIATLALANVSEKEISSYKEKMRTAHLEALDTIAYGGKVATISDAISSGGSMVTFVISPDALDAIPLIPDDPSNPMIARLKAVASALGGWASSRDVAVANDTLYDVISGPFREMQARDIVVNFFSSTSPAHNVIRSIESR